MTNAPIIAPFDMQPNERRASQTRPLFKGIFLGGFECSCHRLEDGRRLDLLARTQHDVWTAADYARLGRLEMTACRDGMPWVRVERRRGVYDFSFAAPMLRAADELSIQVIWDLMHFGWPDAVEVFSPEAIRDVLSQARFLQPELPRQPRGRTRAPSHVAEGRVGQPSSVPSMRSSCAPRQPCDPQSLRRMEGRTIFRPSISTS